MCEVVLLNLPLYVYYNPKFAVLAGMEAFKPKQIEIIYKHNNILK